MLEEGHKVDCSLRAFSWIVMMAPPAGSTPPSLTRTAVRTRGVDGCADWEEAAPAWGDIVNALKAISGCLVLDDVREAEGVRLRDALTLRETEADLELLRDTDGDNVMDALTDGVTDSELEALLVSVVVPVVDGVLLTVVVGLRERLALPVGDACGVKDCVMLREALTLTEGDREAEAVLVAVLVLEADVDTLLLAAALTEADTLTLPVRDDDPLTDALADSDALGLVVGHGLTGDLDGEIDSEGVALGEMQDSVPGSTAQLYGQQVAYPMAPPMLHVYCRCHLLLEPVPVAVMVAFATAPEIVGQIQVVAYCDGDVYEPTALQLHAEAIIALVPEHVSEPVHEQAMVAL